MVKSTISQHDTADVPFHSSLDGRLSATLDPRFRRRLGVELRRRRLERGMTQTDLGDPLTKAFVSAVEHGRAVPSLPALRLMTARLDTTLATFLAAVEGESTSA